MRRISVVLLSMLLILLAVPSFSSAAQPGQPDAITGTKAVAGDGQITITFSKNTGGVAPDEYQIHWWNNTADEAQAQYLPYFGIPASSVTSSTYSQTITGLTNGVTYYFKMYAFKSPDTYSDRSPILSATPGKAAAPTPSPTPAKPVVTDAEKTNRITQSYKDAFNRAPTAAEITYWKGRSDWATYDDLIKLHRVLLKSDAGVQQSVITASYLAVFWQGPTADELKYWQGQLKAKGMTYKELVENHKNFVKSNPDVQKLIINNAFRTDLGRDAIKVELDTWGDQIKKGAVTTYGEMVASLRSVVAGNTNVQANLVRLAYNTAFNRNETAAELTFWKTQITKSKLTFTDVLKTHRDYIKQDKATRTDLIKRSYQEVFGRAPDAKEAAFWEDRLKTYGLFYGEIVLAHKEWQAANLAQIQKNKDLQTALGKKGLTLDTKTGNIVNAKSKAVVYKDGQYFIGTTNSKGQIATIAGSSLVSTSGLNIVASGGGNIVAAGAGNIIAAGAGNIVAAGAGNIVAAGAGNIVAAGAGNIVASGGGNIVAAGAGNIVAAGAGNFNPGGVNLLGGASLTGH